MPKKQIRKNKKVIKKMAENRNNIEELLSKQTSAILAVVDERFQSLDLKMDRKFQDIDGRFQEIDGRFQEIDGRFQEIDGRLQDIDGRFQEIDGRFQEIDGRLQDMDGRFQEIDGRLQEMETKEEQRFDRIMTNLDKLLKATTDTDEEIEFIKFDINRIKKVVKEKLGVNLM